MGATCDDAAGEAFDKVAKYLGLLKQNLHGGPAIENLAKQGDPDAVDFPRSLIDEGFDFSFSGIKTAVLYHCHGQDAGRVERAPDLSENELADVAASFQEAVVDVLCAKTLRAAEAARVKRIVVGGGVAANGRLRERLRAGADARGMKSYFPPMHLCTDNAVMIAGLGYHHLAAGRTAPLDVDAFAQLPRR
jgi:N6-L-threonylcarbamoyladenine synthase